MNQVAELNFDGGNTHVEVDDFEDETAVDVIDETCPGEDEVIAHIDLLHEMERLACQGAPLPRAIHDWIGGENVPLRTVLH